MIERRPCPQSFFGNRVPLHQYVSKHRRNSRLVRECLGVIRKNDQVTIRQLQYVVMKVLQLKRSTDRLESGVDVRQCEPINNIPGQIDLSNVVYKTVDRKSVV